MGSFRISFAVRKLILQEQSIGLNDGGELATLGADTERDICLRRKILVLSSRPTCDEGAYILQYGNKMCVLAGKKKS